VATQQSFDWLVDRGNRQPTLADVANLDALNGDLNRSRFSPSVGTKKFGSRLI